MRQDADRREHGMMAAAKRRFLDIWDDPPAILFWLLLTGFTVGALKVAGL